MLNNKVIISFKHSTEIVEGTIDHFSSKVLSFYSSQNDVYDFLSDDQEIVVSVKHALKGELKYSGRVDQLQGKKVIINLLENIHKNQRRNEVRVNVSIPVEIYKIDTLERLIELDKYISGTVKDLSANGLLLYTDINLAEQLKFYITIQLNEEQIEIVGEIVRKIEQKNAYQYGCKIHTLSNSEADIIRKFVLKEQVQKKFIRKVGLY